MSGRRLLDLGAIIKASKAVASKHVVYRRHQLNAYNRTSSLTRAIKDQTGRITVTLRAASALGQRLNRQQSTFSTEVNQAEKSIPESSIPTQAKEVDEDKPDTDHDHFYERSNQNTTTRPINGDQISLGVKQEHAQKQPLPDGTIPVEVPDVHRKTRDSLSESGSAAQGPHIIVDQNEKQIPSQAAKPPPRSASNPSENQSLEFDQGQDVFYSPSCSTEKTSSAQSRTKIPTATEDIQESDPNVPDEQIKHDVFYTSTSQSEEETLPSAQAVPEQGEPSEDMYSEIFQSPRVAQMLKKRPNKSQHSKGLELNASQNMPGQNKKLGEQRDHVSFNKRETALERGEDVRKPKETEGEVQVREDREEEARSLAAELDKDAKIASEKVEVDENPTPNRYEMRESRVPSSRFGRLWQYGGLATSMAFGAIGESVRRTTGGSHSASGSLMLSAGNMERLVAKLSRMRGAALKLGQMMSFQDSKMLPGPINEVLQRVQDSADYMPPSQRNKVLSINLGSDWRELFSAFDEKPIAAASIGQVHRGVLKSTGVSVAIKVQYPGVANSIDSDLSNLSLLLTASRLLPKGLYLDKTIANARTELAWECDYIREAEAGKRFRHLLQDERDTFVVPSIFDEASGPQVLTMEMMTGTGVTKVRNFTQEQKDWIGTQILRLCLREITEFRYMQTDPNWTNFLFNPNTEKLELLDFGASREYPDKFIIPYIQVLLAASRADRNTVRDLSVELGYLTGYESSAMLNAHINSVLTLAEPFSDKSPEIYDFRDQTITDRVRSLIPVMVRERLAPPPEETYSLHRKLSGAFLLCARLGSRVKCRDMFSNAMIKAGVV